MALTNSNKSNISYSSGMLYFVKSVQVTHRYTAISSSKEAAVIADDNYTKICQDESSTKTSITR
jgi:hypothetical protein